MLGIDLSPRLYFAASPACGKWRSTTFGSSVTPFSLASWMIRRLIQKTRCGEAGLESSFFAALTAREIDALVTTVVPVPPVSGSSGGGVDDAPVISYGLSRPSNIQLPLCPLRQNCTM